jgi:hypothetical protein
MWSIDYGDNNGCVSLDSFFVDECFVLLLIELKLSFKNILYALDGIIFGWEVEEVPSGASGADLDIKV